MTYHIGFDFHRTSKTNENGIAKATLLLRKLTHSMLFDLSTHIPFYGSFENGVLYMFVLRICVFYVFV